MVECETYKIIVVEIAVRELFEPSKRNRAIKTLDF